MNDRGPQIAMACTDRGQHPWMALGDLSNSWEERTSRRTSVVRANRGFVYGVVGERLKNQAVWIDHRQRVHVQCPRCGRHVQWTPDSALKMLEALHAAGMSQLDVSRAP